MVTGLLQNKSYACMHLDESETCLCKKVWIKYPHIYKWMSHCKDGKHKVIINWSCLEIKCQELLIYHGCNHCKTRKLRKLYTFHTSYRYPSVIKVDMWIGATVDPAFITVWPIWKKYLQWKTINVIPPLEEHSIQQTFLSN